MIETKHLTLDEVNLMLDAAQAAAVGAAGSQGAGAAAGAHEEHGDRRVRMRALDALGVEPEPVQIAAGCG